MENYICYDFYDNNNYYFLTRSIMFAIIFIVAVCLAVTIAMFYGIELIRRLGGDWGKLPEFIDFISIYMIFSIGFTMPTLILCAERPTMTLILFTIDFIFACCIVDTIEKDYGKIN